MYYYYSSGKLCSYRIIVLQFHTTIGYNMTLYKKQAQFVATCNDGHLVNGRSIQMAEYNLMQ